MNALTFDPETHTYRKGETVLPSVTQILKDVGLIDTTFFAPEHAERGTRIHEATVFWDETGMDDDTLPEEWAGYLSAWKKFREETGFIPSHIEQAFCSDQGYAGTVDRIGKTHKINPLPPLLAEIPTLRTAHSYRVLQVHSGSFRSRSRRGRSARPLPHLLPTSSPPSRFIPPISAPACRSIYPALTGRSSRGGCVRSDVSKLTANEGICQA